MKIHVHTENLLNFNGIFYEISFILVLLLRRIDVLLKEETLFDKFKKI